VRAPVSRRSLAWAGLLVAGAVLVWVAHRTARPGGILGRRYDLLTEIGVLWLAFLIALACVRALPRRAVVVAVLVLGVAVRVSALSDTAPLSDDLYRYAWDGVVQHAGTDPYRYPPNAAELSHLRDAQGSDWLFPEAWAGTDHETRINRPGVRTIYPPAAEAWFAAVHVVVPLSARDRGYEAVGLLLDLAVLAVLLALLRSRGRDPRWVALYALAPLPALEVVQNAHVDGLALLVALLAVWCAPRRPVVGGAVLAVAALVKIYPALLLPLLLKDRSRAVRVASAFAAVVGLAYLPHLLAVGTELVGYLPGYLEEEQYDAGSRYLVIGLTGLSGTAASVVVAVLGLLALAALWRSALPLEAAAGWLLVAALLLATPVQPWYAVLLLGLATVSGSWRLAGAAVAVCAAAYPLFFATILAGHPLAAGRASYGAAALVSLTMAALEVHARGRAGSSGAGAVTPAGSAPLPRTR
jgi:hypothetical protein